MSRRLPQSKDFRGKTYSLRRVLGSGANGEVGLYEAAGADPIVVKANFCGDPDAESKGLSEEKAAKEASGAVGLCSPLVSRCAKCSLTGDSILRVPLETQYEGDCSFVVYPYFRKNLADWLADTLQRTPGQVVYIFQQLVGIVLCLKNAGYMYTDIKPSNFLVSGPVAAPRLTIGDLGGLQKNSDVKSVEVSAGRVPKSMRNNLNISELDKVTSYLLGGMALELLIRPSRGADAAHPLDSFFDCLSRSDSDSCVGGMLLRLRESLCPGLSLSDPQVRQLAAAALALLGYRGLFMGPEQVSRAF